MVCASDVCCTRLLRHNGSLQGLFTLLNHIMSEMAMHPMKNKVLFSHCLLYYVANNYIQRGTEFSNGQIKCL
uniref:Uncharacterized protein n=1 Tax=Anguilla anguilla TaxID=7936 RepID=A0A0E9WNJ8_ANGAN